MARTRQREAPTEEVLLPNGEQAVEANWLDALFDRAVSEGITDLQMRFVEATQELTVRARLNQMMVAFDALAGRAAVETMTRIKAVSKLTTGPARRFYFGRYPHTVTASGDELDLRVTLLPTGIGETFAIRLPDLKEIPPLEHLGFTPLNRERLMQLLGAANGLTLFVGPMGSGKTTTLYSILKHIGGEDKVVFSVEEPIERRLAGVEQVEINEDAGNGYADVLRGLRRSDLQILMLGEILDPTATRSALEISNAGARVFSSFHANDSIATVEGLVELSGTSVKTVLHQLRGVVSQRLLRTLHTGCAGQGCDSCYQTGFAGVAPIHEVLVIDDVFMHAASHDATRLELIEVARSSGMRSLWDNANELIEQGLTTRDEAQRVLGFD